MKREEIMKKLLSKVSFNKDESLKFLRDSGLVDYHEYTAYAYDNKYGDYIGNSETDDSSELIDKIIEDQDFDEFMYEFIDYFGYLISDNLVENEDGLSYGELAEKILEVLEDE